MTAAAATAMTVPWNQLTAGSRQYGHRMCRIRRRLRHHWQCLFISGSDVELFGLVDAAEDAVADAGAGDGGRADGEPQVAPASLRVERPARVPEHDEQVELPDRD